MMEAKIEAVKRGVSLKDLIASALIRELRSTYDKDEAGHRASFPIIKGRSGHHYSISPEVVRAAEEEDDRLRGGL